MTTYYQGAAGVPVGGFFRRLLFALRFGTTDILVTGQITAESRIMFHRQIAERVQHDRAVPDSSTRIPTRSCTAAGCSGCRTPTRRRRTIRTRRPVQGAGDLNYIRNSVKVVIDAYNGTTTFYLAEPNDPIAQTIDRIFPGLLQPLAEMPAGLRQHVRYPEEIFRDPGGDLRDVPHDEPVGLLQQGRPVAGAGARHRAQRDADAAVLHDHEAAGRDEDRVHPDAAVHAAREGQPVGVDGRAQRRRALRPPARLPVSRSRRSSTARGRSSARINQDQVISPQITLWNQQGSEVIWGTLLVIPIEESLLYVRPLYLRLPRARSPS